MVTPESIQSMKTEILGNLTSLIDNVLTFQFKTEEYAVVNVSDYSISDINKAIKSYESIGWTIDKSNTSDSHPSDDTITHLRFSLPKN
jgi:hypothetical protein